VKPTVKASTHRDQVLVEHLPAATPGDLLDGLTSFRPHVVHFSGHANENLLVFDTGDAEHSAGRSVTASAHRMSHRYWWYSTPANQQLIWSRCSGRFPSPWA
jgi:hypothetical protein